MRGGLLRHKLTIEQKTANGYGATGEALFAWTNYATPNARVITKGAREFERIDQTRGEVSHVFIIRHRDGIDETMRVVYRGNTHQVVGYMEQHGRLRDGWILAKIEN